MKKVRVDYRTELRPCRKTSYAPDTVTKLRDMKRTGAPISSVKAIVPTFGQAEGADSVDEMGDPIVRSEFNIRVNSLDEVQEVMRATKVRMREEAARPQSTTTVANQGSDGK